MFYKIIFLCLSSVLVITLGIVVSGCASENITTDETEDQIKDDTELSIQLISPEESAELFINVLKVAGVVSNYEAIVMINGNEASVNEDKTFSSFIELTPGENTIEAVATYDGHATSQSVEVSFVAPLVINLTQCATESGIDYTKNPVKVKGNVSDPYALVTVNGSPVQVSETGKFSAYVQLTPKAPYVEAVATLGEQQDSWGIIVGLTPEGYVQIVPGLGSGAHINESKITHEETVSIRRGETKFVDITFESGKNIPFYYPHEFYYEISNEVSLPEKGLYVTIEPQRFTAYANTTYHSILVIKATNEIEARGYRVILLCPYSMIGTTEINVKVES